jgi:glutamyl/glutaminyl-tRNA synthetase
MPPSPARPQIVTRFAPSPTGHLHIGGARSALFCWAFSKHATLNGVDGRFMIRIEDTDRARSSEESARGILEDLAWLGIHWTDGPMLGDTGGDDRGVGPYFQAQRVDTYNRYITQLVRAERAYPAFETTEELDANRKAAVAAKQTYRYDRAALAIPLAERLKRIESGEPHVIRLKAPAEEIVVHDQVLGDVRYAAGEMDDFVIRKADGFPTYHFAVVIDDELMGVTHVLRAQEHLNNTPRHVALQRALVNEDTGRPFRTPVYAHMPIIANMDGSKMSKRDKAKTARAAAKDAMKKDPALTAPALAAAARVDPKLLADFLAADSDSVETAEALARHFKIALPEIEVWDFRRNGYLPEAITNFIALLGWSSGLKDEQGRDVEKFDTDFLARHFSVDRIGKTSAKFDRVKLLSFNGDAIAALPDDEFVRRWRAWAGEHDPATAAALSESQMRMVAAAIKPRAKTLRDASRAVEFALTPDEQISYDPKAVDKVLKKGEPTGLAMLREVRAAIAAVIPFEPQPLHQAIDAFCAAKSVGVGAVAQPVRVALTGSTVSPPLGETLALLGKDRALKRIDRCLAAF